MLNFYKHSNHVGGVLVLLLMLCASTLTGQEKVNKLLFLGGAEYAGMRQDTCYTSGKDEHSRPQLSAFWQDIALQGGKMTPAQEAEFATMQTATIIINFGPGFDGLGDDAQAARDAFRFAADIWETEVVSVVPILIDADFMPLAGGTIGSNGSPSVTNVPNAPDPTTNYTLALANAIAGFDLAPGTANGNQTYNTNFTFYFETDGNTPAGLTDFTTVVLHEIGHSMGISGISNGGAGVGANGGANPRSWDLLVELGDGTPILDLGFGTPEQQAALISNDLFINGPLSVAALGGQRPQIFAPNPFQGGSSFSHWNEASFPAGDPNSLMTPFVGTGESNFNIGDITRGVLADQGWVLSSDLEVQDIGVAAITSPTSDSDLGDAETIVVTVQNFGIEAAVGFDVSYRVNGGALVTESFNDTLPAVSVASFAFAQTADFSADATTFTVEAFATLVGDQDSTNDATTADISNLVPAVEVAVASIDFGDIGVGNENTLPLTVSNTASGGLAGEVDITSIVIGSSVFTSDDDLPITIQPGERADLSFTYAPIDFVTDSAVATISTNAGDIEVLFTGTGAQPSDITVSPLALSSTVELGGTDTQFFTISNSGAADLEFSLSFESASTDSMSVAAPFQGSSLSAGNQNNSLRMRPVAQSLRSGDDTQSATAESSVYIIDDGTQESNIGLDAINDLMWLNAFQVAPGADVITSISSAVASGGAETPARFILFEDPDDDGDPSNAVFLTEASGILTDPGANVFTTVNIEPTKVEGVFFVGVLVTEDPMINSFPMPSRF